MRALRKFQERVETAGENTRALAEPLHEVGLARREAIGPAIRLLDALDDWVAHLIMPLFALANAGVTVTNVNMSEGAIRIAVGICAGLVLGKPVGILLATWLVTKLKIAELPPMITWRGMIVLGAVAGVGFTMSIFIAQLAFVDRTTLDFVKTTIFLASTLAAVGGMALGLILLRTRTDR